MTTAVSQSFPPSRPDDRNAAPVLELILERVRLRAHRRAAWLAHLSGGDTTRSHASDAMGGLWASLDHRDTPAAEARWYDQATSVRPINEALERVETALADNEGAPLNHLRQLFNLSDTESDLLQTCLALAIDPTLATVYADLQRHPARVYATESLAARLFGHGRRSLWIPGSSLAVWKLVSAGDAAPGEPSPLNADRVLIGWLQSQLHMDEELIGTMQFVEPRTPLPDWPVETAVRHIQRARERQIPLRVLVTGPPSSGRRSFAAAVATRFGVQLLSVDTTAIGDDDWYDTYIRAQRLAALGNTALVWYGDHLQRSWLRHVIPGSMQFIACDFNQEVAPFEPAADHRIELPAPTRDERYSLWRSVIPESSAWPERDLDTLSTRYRLNAGDIVTVARRGPNSAQEAGAFARELARHRLGELGRLLDCPFTRDDLVVPGKLREALADLAFEARERTAFWESSKARRLFPRGTGLVALFSGPPGTGKTMAAQIIAAELELDLFRIDLATVVSKYIGETAKHLGQVFSRAARMNAVLLFDEADALFSKRTEIKDAHDRYANADTSYLLQLLEEYRGIAILASNKKQNIDPAFVRRVRYVFEFPRPGAAERRVIWRQVIGELIDVGTLERLEATLQVLATSIELSGAQIKNAVLASIFVARRNREALAMAHLLRGVERELNKDGRSLSTQERERLLRNG